MQNFIAASDWIQFSFEEIASILTIETQTHQSVDLD